MSLQHELHGAEENRGKGRGTCACVCWGGWGEVPRVVQQDLEVEQRHTTPATNPQTWLSQDT